uniref:EamA domain-containing protein n=1 Tax=Solibacter usitatus (strain Ellin6076) TaxID=234267 RepID=Q020J4_SOLUE
MGGEKKQAPPRVVYGWLALLLMLWSSNFIFARFALRELPLGVVLGFRYVFSAALMLPVIALGGGQSRVKHPWNWHDLPGLLTIGLLGLVGNQALFVVGISMTSVAHAGVITALSPVLVLLGSAALGHERISGARIVGLLTAACGVVVLQFSRGAAGAATLKGDAVMLASVVVFAGFNLAAKPYAERAGTVRVNAIAYFAAGLLALPLALWSLSRGAHGSLLAWCGVAYMAAGSSVAGYLIYAYALRHLAASRVSVVVYLQPIVVTLLAIVALGERPGAGFLPAVGLVLAGVWVVERRG